jgi:hypothetical protein
MHGRPGPQGGQDVQAFIELGRPVGRCCGRADRGERGIIGCPGSDAEDQAPAGQVVNGHCLRGQFPRKAAGQRGSRPSPAAPKVTLNFTSR